MEQTQGFSFNWGHGILTVILLFLGGMFMMVFVASRQTNEMMDEHYYQKEMAYQGIIDAARNLQSLTTQSILTQTREKLIIQFPVGSYENFQNGSVELLRNDAKKRDVHFEIIPSGSDQFGIPKTGLTKGLYKIRVKWTNQQIPYYFEENVFVDG